MLSETIQAALEEEYRQKRLLVKCYKLLKHYRKLQELRRVMREAIKNSVKGRIPTKTIIFRQVVKEQPGQRHYLTTSIADRRARRKEPETVM